MTIWMTGATGFLGRNLLACLLKRYPDQPITCLVRDPVKAKSQWPDRPANVRWLAGDLLAPDTYQDSLQQAERVFHVAAMVSLKNGPAFYRQNTEATRYLTEALKANNCLERLVFVSSISAIDRPLDSPATELLTELSVPQPNTDYGKSKLQAEQVIQSSGLPYTIMIPAYIYGPYPRPDSSMDRLIADMLAGKSYTRFPFPGEASAIYVDDLAEALCLAADHPNTLNERFLIANPQPVRIEDAYKQLAEALGLQWESRMKGSQFLSRYQSRWRQSQGDSLMLRVLFQRYFACSPAKWYRATRFVPRTSLAEGLLRTVKWYRTQGV